MPGKFVLDYCVSAFIKLSPKWKHNLDSCSELQSKGNSGLVNHLGSYLVFPQGIWVTLWLWQICFHSKSFSQLKKKNKFSKLQITLIIGIYCQSLVWTFPGGRVLFCEQLLLRYCGWRTAQSGRKWNKFSTITIQILGNDSRLLFLAEVQLRKCLKHRENQRSRALNVNLHFMLKIRLFSTYCFYLFQHILVY